MIEDSQKYYGSSATGLEKDLLRLTREKLLNNWRKWLG